MTTPRPLRPLRLLGRRHHGRTPPGPPQEQGFSLALVVLASLMLTAGGLALANRSSQGLLGSVFHAFGLQAREAAEIGVTRIVTELNKPGNRGLLHAKGASTETTPWNVSDLTTSYRSKCPGSGSPTLASNVNIGAPSSGTTYNRVYLYSDGSVSSSRIRNGEAATRAYRLVSATRRPETELNIFQAITPPEGELGLEVEGMSLRADGTVISMIRLRRDLQVIPKCCGVSFGGNHGNVSYERKADGSFACLNQSTMLGLGFLGGTGDSTGTIELGGSSTVIKSGTSTTPVYINEIFCLADVNGVCNSSNVSSSQQAISVTLINPRPDDFPVAKEFPADPAMVAQLTRSQVPGVLSRPGPNAPTTQFIGCFKNETADPNDPDLATVENGKKCKVWTVNADANNLPGYCARDAYTEDVHCVVERITLKSSDMVVLTNHVGTAASGNPKGVSRLRLYFVKPSTSSNDYLIDGFQGTNAIYHCRAVSFSNSTDKPFCSLQPDSTKDFSIFGCNVNHTDGSSHPAIANYPYSDCASPGTQNIRLVGAAGGLNMFAYFPNGKVEFYGNTFFEGVVWANTITATGSVQFVVPGAGLSDVMEYMGLMPGSDMSTRRNPILFDYVARSSNRFRWLGR